MGDVVSIEVDGEPGEPRFENSRGRPPWGMPAAIALVGVLVLAVGWSALRSDGASSVGAPGVPTPTTRRESPATTEVPLILGGASTTATAVPAQALDPIPNPFDPVQAARGALAAWGEFAVTGDLTEVRLSFSPDGPQLAQLEDEAERIAPAASVATGYVVNLSNPDADVAGAVATVTGIVTWSRTGESDQTYRWAIELRQAGDGIWRLFTVRTPQS